ncbi:hypothetical protein [Lacipirellula sp.]|uniref:hypothetical protein n=1 Tax=Lacipirellula sp. TaxID=2691419 RepID=UPI003D107ADC
MRRKLTVQFGNTEVDVDLDEWIELASASCKKEKAPGEFVDHAMTVARHADGRIIIYGKDGSRDRFGGYIVPNGKDIGWIRRKISDAAEFYGLPMESAELCFAGCTNHPRAN